MIQVYPVTIQVEHESTVAEPRREIERPKCSEMYPQRVKSLRAYRQKGGPEQPWSRYAVCLSCYESSRSDRAQDDHDSLLPLLYVY